jgi:trans-aconitate 2-methyltransferase
MIETPYAKWGLDFVNKLDLHAQKKILDIGCRNGPISSFLAKKYPRQQFLAIDNLVNEIEIAKSNKLPNLTFETSDALHLDYIEYFDAIVSFHCLLWIQDKRKVLKNIYAALKPGKKAFLQFFIIHGRPKNDRYLYQVAELPKWKNYFKNFIPSHFETSFSEFSGLLQSVGFWIERMEITSNQKNFSHKDELQQFIGTWASHQKKLPPRKRDHFLSEATHLYLKDNRINSNEVVPYNEYFLEVECIKPLEVSCSPANNYFQYKDIIFTQHEARVIKYFLQGKSAKETSRIINKSSRTVEFHLGHIKEKLNLKLRSELYQAAINYGFIHLLFNNDL